MWFPGFTPWDMRATAGDHRGAAACRRDLRVESNERRPARAGVHVVMLTAAREGLMREHEAGRGRSPRRGHLWFKRISQAVTQVSLLSPLLTTGARSSLAARKNKGRDDRDGTDQSAKDRDRSGDRNQDSKSENGRNEERTLERENNDKAGRDGDGRNSDRERRQERRDDDSSDDSPAVNKKQQSNQNNKDSNNPDGDQDTAGGNDDTTTGGNADT